MNLSMCLLTVENNSLAYVKLSLIVVFYPHLTSYLLIVGLIPITATLLLCMRVYFVYIG